MCCERIFVRQKNRCSSKAPENPIKAVRRMKTSPLTADEQARIQEGLRVFKFDWMSIWKFVVPHRDPSLLPRQWRIALGTQKSYKIDAAKKEKRRLYESKRRKNKAADLASWQTISEKEDYQPENAGGEISGDDSIDNEDEVYVHEAFLADWRPGTSSLGSSEPHCSNLGENNLPSDILSREGTQVMEQLNNYGSGETLPQKNNMKEFTAALRNSQHPYTHLTHVRHGASNIMEPNHSVPDLMLKSSKSPFYLRPYRVRRTNSAHLVKLAPDLPPVNLPPSVRVISQSAFKSYQCGASAKVSVSGGGNVGAGIENAVPKLPHVAKLGTVYSMKGGQNKSNSLKHDITNSRLEESRVHKDKCVPEERGSESDLQMHPLLFQATEGGHLPYYALNCSTSTSSSFSFFSGNQPQVNLSLFRNPHHSNPSVNCCYKSSKSKETTSTSCGIDFHPLLQRTDDVNSDLATACLTPHLPVHLDSFRGKFSQLQSSFDAVQAESQVNSDPSATTTKPSSPNEKANELDLEIHLSSTSRKKKALGSRDLMEHNPMRSTISAMGSRTTMGTQNTNNMYYRHFETCPTVSSKLVSDAPASAIPSNNINRYSMDSVGDQSLPEIVMEQEELSDSDEEIGERVEFECEEMADSEGEEGSDSEQIADVLNKEAPNFVMEKVLTDADCDDQQCDLRTQGDCQGNVCNPGKGSTLSLKLGLTGQGKDNTGTSSWLSLDSRAQDCPPCAKPKRVEGTHGEGRATKKWASCRPNRSCKKKKPSPKRVTAQKHARDTPQQLNLGSLAVTPLRKLRKRGCKTNLNLNTEMTVESSSCLSNDKFS
ncbi:hypothetical protein L1049_010265 [Liquidambar formosana]|uniref:Homeodomain-like superfamily protein n=1 Tax=Liquidambar formosana TaxID=63359 RepID=A0AAP0NB50_LIQFO